MQLVNSVLSFLEVFCAYLNAMMPFPGHLVTHVRTYCTQRFHHLIKPVTFPASVPLDADEQFCSMKSSFTYTVSFFGEVCVTIYYKSNACNLN